MALSWRRVFVLSLGSALLVNVSLGPMAGEIGAASVLVWGCSAFIGLVQCLLLGELGSRYPDLSGGPPAYVHAGLSHVSPLWGGMAAWAYWTAWIPGVAVHVLLAATYVNALWPDVDRPLIVAALLALLYGVNYFGLGVTFWTSSVMAACCIGPLVLILAVPLLRHADPGAAFPVVFSAGQVASLPSFLIVTKWMFVAAWSAYAAEMATTLISGLRGRRRAIPKVLGLAGVVTLASFTLVPAALIMNVGASTLAAEPYIVFLTATRGLFGAAGTTVVGVMLIAALLSSAQLFIISSSRALYEMSRKGLMPRVLTRVNRYDVPVGSVGWDAAVTLALVGIFGDNVVNIVAAANVSYLLVFVLLPAAYIVVRRRETPSPGVWVLPPFMTAVACGVLLINALLLIVSALQWGAVVVAVGLLLVAAGIPVCIFSRRAPVVIARVS